MPGTCELLVHRPRPTHRILFRARHLSGVPSRPIRTKGKETLNPLSRSGIALVTGENYTPWQVQLSASWTAPRTDTHWEELMWDQGTLPFVHLMIDDTMPRIFHGHHDAEMRAWFTAIRQYETTGRQMVIVLLPEMNGNWTTYGQEWEPDRTLFTSWFQRMVNTARSLGVESWFCWAPNNWGFPGDDLEWWWPGDDYVDVVGMSCYNWGGWFPDAPMEWPVDVVEPYVEEVRDFTDAPIVITQVGSHVEQEAWLDALIRSSVDNDYGFIWFDADHPSIWQRSSEVFAYRVGAYREDPDGYDCTKGV